MMQASPISFGKLNGAKYDFPFEGDVLPMHTHGENDTHISIVSKGSFRAHGDGKTCIWDEATLSWVLVE